MKVTPNITTATTGARGGAVAGGDAAVGASGDDTTEKRLHLLEIPAPERDTRLTSSFWSKLQRWHESTPAEEVLPILKRNLLLLAEHMARAQGAGQGKGDWSFESDVRGALELLDTEVLELVVPWSAGRREELAERMCLGCRGATHGGTARNFGLFVRGGVGTGKTTLLRAVVMGAHLSTMPEPGKEREIFPVYIPRPTFVQPVDPAAPFAEPPMFTLDESPSRWPVPISLLVAEAIRAHLGPEHAHSPLGLAGVPGSDPRDRLGMCWSLEAYTDGLSHVDWWFDKCRRGRGGMMLVMDEMQELYRTADRTKVNLVYGQIYNAIRFPHRNRRCHFTLSGSSSLFATTYLGRVNRREELGEELLAKYPSLPDVFPPPHPHYVRSMTLDPLWSTDDMAWMLRFGLPSGLVHSAVKQLTQGLTLSVSKDGEVMRRLGRGEHVVELDGNKVDFFDVARRTAGIPRLLVQFATEPGIAMRGRAQLVPSDVFKSGTLPFLYAAMAVALNKSGNIGSGFGNGTNVLHTSAVDPFAVSAGQLAVSLADVLDHLTFMAEKSASAEETLKRIVSSSSLFPLMKEMRLWSDRGVVHFDEDEANYVRFPSPAHALEGAQKMLEMLRLPQDIVQELLRPSSRDAGHVGAFLVAASLSRRHEGGTALGLALEEHGHAGPLSGDEWQQVVSAAKGAALSLGGEAGGSGALTVATVSTADEEAVLKPFQWAVPTPDAGTDLLLLLPLDESNAAVAVVVGQAKLSNGRNPSAVTKSALDGAKAGLEKHYVVGKTTTAEMKDEGGNVVAAEQGDPVTTSVSIGTPLQTLVERSMPGATVHRIDLFATNRPLGKRSSDALSCFQSTDRASLVLLRDQMMPWWIDTVKATAHWLDLDSYGGRLTNGEQKRLASRLEGTAGGELAGIFDNFKTRRDREREERLEAAAQEQAKREAEQAKRKAEQAKRKAELEAAELEQATVTVLQGTGLRAHALKLAKMGLTVDDLVSMSDDDWSSVRDALLEDSGASKAWAKVLDRALAELRSKPATQPAPKRPRGRPRKRPAASGDGGGGGAAAAE